MKDILRRGHLDLRQHNNFQLVIHFGRERVPHGEWQEVITVMGNILDGYRESLGVLNP